MILSAPYSFPTLLLISTPTQPNTLTISLTKKTECDHFVLKVVFGLATGHSLKSVLYIWLKLDYLHFLRI